MGGSDGFLGTIIEIVPERGANLAFEFDGGNEPAFVDDEQIP